MTCKNCNCEDCPDDCNCENCSTETCNCQVVQPQPQDDFGYKQKMNGGYIPTIQDYFQQFRL